MGDKIVSAVFSLPSLVAHALISVVWLSFGLNLNVFTNLLSIEAILLTILVGLNQKAHQDSLDRVQGHLRKHLK